MCVFRYMLKEGQGFKAALSSELDNAEQLETNPHKLLV